MTKIVVAGGTGFIGRGLVRALLLAGHDVTLLARDVESARAHAGDARVVSWSLAAGAVRDRWTEIVGGAGAVVNLAGAGVMDAAWTSARRQQLRASRIDVTKALAEAMAGGGPPPRVLVSASAVGIYGLRMDDEVLPEETPPGTDFLAELCVDWEAAAEPARAAGVRVVHPRLGIVLGADGGALAVVARPFRLHAGGPIGSGRQWVSWVHERDVIAALMLAVSAPALSGAYNFVAPRPVRMQEEALAIASVLDTHAKARVPGFVLKTMLGRGRAEAILTGQRASSGRLEAAGYRFAFPELRPALEDLLGAR